MEENKRNKDKILKKLEKKINEDWPNAFDYSYDNLKEIVLNQLKNQIDYQFKQKEDLNITD